MRASKARELVRTLEQRTHSKNMTSIYDKININALEGRLDVVISGIEFNDNILSELTEYGYTITEDGNRKYIVSWEE